MRILVTGGAGFIGSHTVDALLERGHEVRVLDALTAPVHPKGEVPSYLSEDVEFVQGRVEDEQSLRRALADVDAVYHLAAHQDYQPDFSRYFAVNTVSTALLYEIIVAEKLPIQRVIVASSQAIYGEGRYRCTVEGTEFRPGPRDPARLAQGLWEIDCPACGGVAEPLPTDESEAHPHNSYGLSKRDQDDIARHLGGRYGVPSVAMRYSIVQGPRQSFHNTYSGALRAFAVRVLNGQPPLVYEDGAQLRDYVSIHDVVRANLMALEDERMVGRSFNVGADRRVRVDELARLVVEEAGASVEAQVPGLHRVGDTRHVFSDVEALKALGWSVQVSQREAVREYLAWAEAQPDLPNTSAEAERRMRASGVLREVPPRTT